MNILVIGLGSIAKKHIKALKEINANTHIYALRSSSNAEIFETVTNITSVNNCPGPDFIIISNPTALHAAAIKKVSHLKKPLFIEKPPFHKVEDATAILKLISEQAIKTYTAFNLRFLECLMYVKENIQLDKVQEVNVYCGSYLPAWRPNTDYKKNYSANTELGGGVHLDLIHELDYVLWTFGKPLEIKKTLRSKSKIEINSVDYANYTLIYEHFVVTIILNYFRRDTKRTCEIILDNTTWNVNLVNNTVTDLQTNKLIFQSNQTVQDTYKNQMEYFINCIANGKELTNSLTESVNTLKIALA